jgi:hypothetical protein
MFKLHTILERIIRDDEMEIGANYKPIEKTALLFAHENYYRNKKRLY